MHLLAPAGEMVLVPGVCFGKKIFIKMNGVYIVDFNLEFRYRFSLLVMLLQNVIIIVCLLLLS
jgi:hypothetical protein